VVLQFDYEISNSMKSIYGIPRKTLTSLRLWEKVAQRL